MSSEYNPHSNLRAETAVKTAKRLLMTCTKSNGSPDWDMVTRALLQHRNTPIKDLGFSPAQLIFGRPIKDMMPFKSGLYKPSEVWVTCREQRELALRQKVIKDGERWEEHTKPLPPLKHGQHVFIQNQKGAGKQAKRWDKTGIVVEDSGHDKYMVRVDGSGRIVNRNRQYLRNFKPAMTQPTMPATRSPIANFSEKQSQGGEEEMTSVPSPVRPESPLLAPQPIVDAPMTPEPPPPTRAVDSSPEMEMFSTPPSEPRRSGRIRKPNPRYSEKEFDLSSVTVVENQDSRRCRRGSLWGGGNS